MLCAFVVQVGAKAASATPSQPWSDEIEARWGGHFKTTGTLSHPGEESFLQPAGTDTFSDGSMDFRLKNKIFWTNQGYFETHYEALALGGDTRRKKKELEQTHPNLFKNGLISGSNQNDDRRLMDLTKTINEKNDYIIYHRLDRLALTWQPHWGNVSVGRQALTWGNGLLFNPMDLFNPFAPTDIERDYKVGDDMATIQFAVDTTSEFQILCVPRRNPATNSIEKDQSSMAAKLHLAAGITEFDIMTAVHYQDKVIGFGSTGYLKEAAWRLDATYTFLHDDGRRDGFLSLVANMDYAWVWQGNNFYGFLEFYYNGLGSDQYSEALSDPDVSERWSRGELFTLGRKYLSGEIQMELHPLFNLRLSVINNLTDPSGLLQPRGIWDMKENIQLICGASIYYGETGTEYGGFKIPTTTLLSKPSDNTYLWLTFFF